MLVLPAIDLKGGEAVQLRQGDFEQARQYGDPAAAAARWLAKGAQYLHIVDLDAAAAGHPVNRSAVASIVGEAARAGVPVQLGGGLRAIVDVVAALHSGVTRVVLGTAAAKSPDLAEEMVRRFGAEKIVVSLDARDGVVATHGWRLQSRYSVHELAAELVSRGVRRFVYTDITQDGTLTSPDTESTLALARATSAAVIAAGGITTTEHVRALGAAGCEGVIVGTALYEGRLTLEDAQTAAAEAGTDHGEQDT
ncbi:MAG: 1-(5-phosphoribosyl)-5-[(5-phosphoribosylamino)methylideneamino]imidazole-4-carboxamide isomerase [Dehalococcoidia bacterium]|nr:1-(5-phosphoribosyl)-5-[(5-phosphoribosylamino)methylideneamino]imidazole-4-carboxamide isomerase [Dehalococcoidia bacterium]